MLSEQQEKELKEHAKELKSEKNVPYLFLSQFQLGGTGTHAALHSRTCPGISLWTSLLKAKIFLFTTSPLVLRSHISVIPGVVSRAQKQTKVQYYEAKKDLI